MDRGLDENMTGHEFIQVHCKIQEKVQRFPISLLPLHMHSLHHYQHPHQSGTFVTTDDEPTLTHDNHPKSIVYLRVHSWCCIFYGFRFGQRYNGMYPSLWYHTK